MTEANITNPEPDLPPGAIKATERGFPVFAEFTDLYRSRVDVMASSRAFHPAVWVHIDGTPANRGGVGSDGSGHFSIEQAKVVRDALTAWITWAEDLIDRGLYWPEGEGNDE